MSKANNATEIEMKAQRRIADLNRQLAEVPPWKTPEKYRDRLLRAAQRMVDRNHPRNPSKIVGGLEFLEEVDKVLDAIAEKK